MATIKELQEELVLLQDLQDPVLEALQQDQRTGVQRLVAKRRQEIQAEIDEDQHRRPEACGADAAGGT